MNEARLQIPLREADGGIYTSTEPVETESEDTDHG